MARGPNSDEMKTARRRLSALLFLAGMLVGASVATSLMFYRAVRTPQTAQPSQSAPAAVTPPAATPPTATPPTAADKDASVYLTHLTPEEMRRLNRELLTYQNFWDSLRLFLPILGGLLVTIIGTLGFYLVRSNFFEAQMAMKDELHERLDAMDADLRQWKSEVQTRLKDDFAEFQTKLNDLQERARTELDAKAAQAASAAATATETARNIGDESRKGALEQAIQVDLKIQQVHDILAVGCWNMKDYGLAIWHARRALDTIQKILDRLDQTDSRWARLSEHKLTVTSELAYYCAESYRASAKPEDAAEAIRCARLLVPYLDDVESTRQMDRIGVIDNYLFVICHIQPLKTRDKHSWLQYFETWRSDIQEYLREKVPERADPLFRSYETFARALQQEAEGAGGRTS